MRKPELLAPAGSYNTLETVLAAGADAVYLSGKSLNMRMRRPDYNFTLNELAEIIPFIHGKGAKAYLAMNSLVYQEELNQAKEMLEFLQAQKADAIIVQDLGVLALAQKHAPQLRIHISTQTNVHNSWAAKALAKMGVKRVVLSNELTWEELREIREKSSLELECFVFGARCLSYTGNCYLSTSLGGGVGNRGKCSKPCRLLYQKDNKKDYYLSPKDMCLLSLLPKLQEVGIDSYKIEGRMEKKEILGEIVQAFRLMIDQGLSQVKEKEEELEQLIGRSFKSRLLLEKNDKNYLQLKEAKGENVYPAFDKAKRKKINLAGWLGEQKKKAEKGLLAVYIDKNSLCPAAQKADIFYLGGESLYDEENFLFFYHQFIQWAKKEKKQVWLALPVITKDCEMKKISSLFKKIDYSNLQGCLVSSLAAWYFIKENTSLPLAIDYQMNIFNEEGLNLIGGAESICLHPESKLNLAKSKFPLKEVEIWGWQPGMILEDYWYKSFGWQEKIIYLKTEAGVRVKLEKKDKRIQVVPAKRNNLIRQIKHLRQLGVDIFRLDLRDVSIKNCQKIISLAHKEMED